MKRRWFVCQEEMEQALVVEVVLELEEVCEEEVVGAGWEVPDLVLAPPGSVYVPPVEPQSLTKQEHPAIKGSVQTAVPQW